MYAGSPYLIQPQYLDVCLRDPMGHISALELCNPDGGQRPCSCSHIASSLEHTAVARGPTLTAYKGANSRLSAIIGRYFDRLGACRSSSFQWPYDAERMAMDLDADLMCFEASVAQLPSAMFRMGQKEVLSLCVAALRGDVAKRLCDAFAANLLSREKALLPEAVDWMLQRRSLDTAKALILRAVDVPRTSSLGARVSWVFFPKFVHRHTMDLLVAARRWTARQHDAEGTAYLLDCLRHAIMGRNFLVLLTRRSELPAAKRLVDEVCAHTLEVLGTWIDGGEREEEDDQRQRRLTVRNAEVIVNDAALMADIEARLPAPLPPNLENLDFNLDETLASLFADLPALEQLFGFGAAAPVQ
ncbi:hypothetical protein FA10DRAFT_128571 [Acaromyces ingoldii]|uniref:Uncharacterized protein n=1 Tax=Acaromyces ingoldii TaxID=215250 RepID=A0A316YN48_9BASI|nr:hypothetical protein FA10DRAFT_128571 [Acaromyces ingoldii]PWN90970.1 hypothetical protein FA10DRAFT_128571 [Acaromyces ingoldii]